MEADEVKLGRLCRLVYDDLSHTLRLSEYDATAVPWAVLRLYSPSSGWAQGADRVCMAPERRKLMMQLGLELPEPPASGDGEAIGSCNDLLNALAGGFRAECPELAENHFGSVLGTRLVVIDRTGHWIPEEMRFTRR